MATDGGRAGLRRAASFARQAVTAAALTLLVGIGALTIFGSEQPATPRAQLDLSGKGIDVLIERHGCSKTGFDDGVVPSRALLRHSDGRIEVVSFDRGWASFTGDAPGTLVAVCRSASGAS